MVRLLVHELMARRGITAYALSRGAKLSYPSAYRLSRRGGRFGRLHADTLDKLCNFFRVQPGALLEWEPPKRPQGAKYVRRGATPPARRRLGPAPGLEGSLARGR